MFCPSCFNKLIGSARCPECKEQRDGIYLPVGTSLRGGEYHIGKVLGKPGGFGITYLAWNTQLDVKVAIKEFLPFQIAGRAKTGVSVSVHTEEYQPDFDFGLDRFLEEAKTLAQFRHPNIVRVLNFFRENGTAYMVMDYLEGESLAEYLARVGKLTGPDAVALFSPILDGLAHIHERNFLHRDIKPANIYLTHEGQAILLDFGSARQSIRERSQSLTAVVTPGFAPWEQYHKKGKQGPWTDVYACAATLYFMISGVVPPDGTDRLVDDDIVALGELVQGLDKHIADAVMQGLTVNPEKRHQTTNEFAVKLVEYKRDSFQSLQLLEKIAIETNEMPENSNPFVREPQCGEMKYFSDDNDDVKGECAACNRVLKVPWKLVGFSKGALVLNEPVGIKCPCGLIYKKIVGFTGNKMKYFSDDNDDVKGECAACNRVLKVPWKLVGVSKGALELNNPIGIKCPCGVIHERIVGLAGHKSERIRNAQSAQKKTGMLTKGLFVASLVLILIMAATAVYFGFFAGGTSPATLPREAVVVPQTKVLSGHTSSVNSVAFSVDGRTLVSGSSDRSIRLWDTLGGRELKNFIGEAFPINSVAISPDGRTVVSGSDSRSTRLWDVASGRELKVLGFHGDAVASVSISPDGKTLAVGTANTYVTTGNYSQVYSADPGGIIVLWDMDSGKQVKTLHAGKVSFVAFCQDGQTLVGLSKDGSIKIWDVTTGEILSSIFQPNAFCVSVSSDRRTAAIGGGDKNVRLWNLSSGMEIKTLVGHTDNIYAVAISPDGRKVISGGSDRTIRLWDISTGRVLMVLTGHTAAILSVAFSPDGKVVSSGSADKTVRLWDISSINNN